MARSPARPRNGYGDSPGGAKSDWREFVAEIKGIHNDEQEGNTVLHTSIQRGADRETLAHLIATSRNLDATNNVRRAPCEGRVGGEASGRGGRGPATSWLVILALAIAGLGKLELDSVGFQE